jgi:hypothetical protein
MNPAYEALINNGWTKYSGYPYSEYWPSFEKAISSQQYHILLPRAIDNKPVWIYDFYDYSNVSMPTDDYNTLNFSSIEEVLKFLDIKNENRELELTKSS